VTAGRRRRRRVRIGGRWALLTVLTASYGAGAFGMLGFSPLSPSLVEGFALGRLRVAFIVPSIYLGGLFFSLPAGRLADRIGVRPTFLGGLTLGALGLVAAAGSPVFTVFLLCLFVAGIGWSVVNPALGKAIVDLFPMRERGIAMGIKQMGLTVGGVAAALILPPIAAVLGWRFAIATCGAIVAVSVALSRRALRRLDDQTRAAAVTAPEAHLADASGWALARRPPLLVFFATGLSLGMVQAAVLSYLPLYMAFASIVVGLLAGPAVFGLLLVTFDSYTVSWATFALLAALVAVAILLTGPAIDRVRPA